ncbi:MAG: phosphotransferase [Pseudomonadota bacterium]|nr:phosphotransferase [Pseudomonadota bacterium]
MNNRDHQIDKFLSKIGWHGVPHSPLAHDASFRRYKRITTNGMSAVLMDAPSPREDVRPFIKVSHILTRLGLSAPQIYAKDLDVGFLLLEDLGDATFSRLLNDGASAEELYMLAIDVLVELHRRIRKETLPLDIASYAKEVFFEEAALLVNWYLPAVLKASATPAAQISYRKIWEELFAKEFEVPTSLVLRDFHVDNLIFLKGRSGIRGCGILDFQDAVIGPVSYDFVSLLQDARRDVSSSVVEKMHVRYLEAFPMIDARAFDVSSAILAAQRHCKVLGIFTRLRDRDGKDTYLQHTPRLWRLLEQGLRNPVLARLKDWFDEYIPKHLRIIPAPRPPR